MSTPPQGASCESERLWQAARKANASHRGRARASAGITGVLIAMRDGVSLHGGEIARLAEQGQANVTACWLPQLELYGFVVRTGEEWGLGHQGGGKPATLWRLTSAGKKLVNALLEEGHG